MKLEPVAVMDRDGDVYKSLPSPNWHPPHTNLYSEAQLIAEIERRDAVLRLALEALGNCVGDSLLGGKQREWAIKAIKEALE